MIAIRQRTGSKTTRGAMISLPHPGIAGGSFASTRGPCSGASLTSVTSLALTMILSIDQPDLFPKDFSRVRIAINVDRYIYTTTRVVTPEARALYTDFDYFPPHTRFR